MGVQRELATWLVRKRSAVEAELRARLGGRLPAAAAPETEALRRFRSFVTLALGSGGEATPALDGLRVHEARVGPLIEGWVEAASAVAGPDGPRVREELLPLVDRFRAELRQAAPSRRASGAPRASRRRAVTAAIDRVSDVFLAVDADTGTIEDANPAAGALLGVPRDQLLGAELERFVPESDRDTWDGQLEALAEGGDLRRFRAPLCDAQGRCVALDASLTRFSTRRRTLALVLGRPLGGAAARNEGARPGRAETKSAPARPYAPGPR